MNAKLPHLRLLERTRRDRGWRPGRIELLAVILDSGDQQSLEPDGRLIAKIPVGAGPHGLCVWPQPGRYSLGHTGDLR